MKKLKKRSSRMLALFLAFALVFQQAGITTIADDGTTVETVTEEAAAPSETEAEEMDADGTDGAEAEIVAEDETTTEAEYETEPEDEVTTEVEAAAEDETTIEAEDETAADEDAAGTEVIAEEAAAATESLSLSSGASSNIILNDQDTFVWEDDEKVVTVVLTDPEALPSGAEFVVEDVSEEEYEAYRALITEQVFANDDTYGDTEEERLLCAEAALQNMVLYDMYFTCDGEEIEPDSSQMSVTIEFKTAVSQTTDEILEADDYILVPDADAEAETIVLHIEETTEGEKVVDVTDAVETDADGAVEAVEFTVDSFSIIGYTTVATYYTVAWTNDTLIDNYGGSYTLYYILNNYNIFSSGNVTAYHTVGAVAVGGEAAFPSSIGSSNYTITVPSYFAGDITAFGNYIDTGGFGSHAMYLTGYDDTLQDYLYARITFDGTTKGEDPFIDFDAAMAAIKIEISEYVNDVHNITVDPAVASEYYEISGTTVTLKAGYSYVFDSFDAYDFINVVGDDNVNIICKAEGNLVLPEVILNGEKIDGSETDQGCGVTFLLPNADYVDIGTKTESGEFFGHVVAPNAEVYSTISGNTNGSFICASFNVPNMENHMWHYDGTIIVSTSFTGSKTVDSSIPAAGETFAFTLYESTAVTDSIAGTTSYSWEKVQTVENATETSGLIAFDEITYTKEGTHWYLISENTGDTTKYTFDDTLYIIKVEITKKTENGKTTYDVTKSYYKTISTVTNAASLLESDGSVDTSDTSVFEELTLSSDVYESDIITFGNASKGELSLSLLATKTLLGRTLEAGQFSFTVTGGKNNAVNVTVTNHASGNVIFSNIDKYDDTDIGKTYYYTVSEVNDGASGYTYDNTEYTVTVKVVDTGNGTLDTEITYESSEDPDGTVSSMAFENTYAANGEIYLEAEKSLRWQTLEADQFTFNATQVDADGNVVSGGYSKNATNDAAGLVVFPVIQYTAAGTYYYKITETNEDKAGYIYDSSAYIVEVSVTDDGSGTLTANITDITKNGSSVSAVAFGNTYIASGTLSLEATKVLIGATLQANQFSFNVTGGKNNVDVTVTNDEYGKVTFTDIDSYDQTDIGKEYTYTVKEVNTGKTGYTYDYTEYTVTVKVVDNGDGTLGTEITYRSSEDINGIVTYMEFENTYAADGEIYLEAEKSLSGHELAENQFTFTITEVDANGNAVANGYSGSTENYASGLIIFPVISYSTSGTYYYEIRETDDGESGYTYDNSVYTVTVTVTDDVSGTLTATAPEIRKNGVAVDKVTFGNTYTASGTLSLTAKKTLTATKKQLTAGQFSFTVIGGKLKSAVTATNDASGNITFTNIDSYDETDIGKEYTYIVAEVDVGKTGYTYDTTEYNVTVKVLDNGDGTLEPDVTIVHAAAGTFTAVSEMTFANTYTAEGEICLGATKTLSGRTLEADQFTFTITQVDASGNTIAGGYSDSVKNAAGGSVTFPVIKYTTDGTYYYKIQETNDGQSGYSYDSSEYIVTVTVKYDNSGELEASVTGITKNGETAVAVVFGNTYTANASLTLKAVKSMARSGMELGTFSFELRDSSGNVLETVKNDSTGVITFSALTYTQSDIGKTYTYTVREKAESGTEYIFDTTVYTVTVSVGDNGDGTLGLTVKVNGADYTDTLMKFTNDIETEEDGEEEEETWEEENETTVEEAVAAQTGDEAPLALYLGLLTLAALGLLLAEVIGRRKRYDR